MKTFNIITCTLVCFNILYSQDLPLVAKDNKTMKCGYVDSKGTTIIPYQYYSVWDFESEGVAWVREGNDTRYSLIDKTGKVILNKKYFYAFRFHDGLALVSVGGTTHGYINKTGKEVIPCQFTDAVDFSEGLASVRKTPNSKRGYIDVKGKMVIPAIYDETGSFIHGVAVVTTAGKQNVINKSGREAFSLNGNIIVDYFNNGSNGLAVIQSPSNKLGLIDYTGKIVVEPKYEQYSLENFKNNFDYTRASVGAYNKMGLIDKTGKELTAFKYDLIMVTEKDAAIFKSGNLWGILDNNGKEIIPAKYKDIKGCSENLFAAQDAEGLWSLIDKTGKVYTKKKYSSYMTPFEHDGYKNVYSMTYAKYLTIFIDTDGDEIDIYTMKKKSDVIYNKTDEDKKSTDKTASITEVKYENLYIDSKGGKYGFLNGKSEVVIPYIYAASGFTFSEGLVSVSIDGINFGYIDTKGNTVIPFEYTSAGKFKDGLTPVFKNGKGGYIDRTGKIIIPFQYEAVHEFNMGSALVKRFDDPKSILINKNGEILK